MNRTVENGKAVVVTASNKMLFETMIANYPDTLKYVPLVVVVDERREGNLTKSDAIEIVEKYDVVKEFKAYTEKDMFEWGRSKAGINTAFIAEKHLYSNCLFVLAAVFDLLPQLGSILIVEDDVILFDRAYDSFSIGHTAFASMGTNWCQFNDKKRGFIWEYDKGIIETHNAMTRIFGREFVFDLMAMSYHNGGAKLLCRKDWDIELVKDVLKKFYEDDTIAAYNEKHLRSKQGLKHAYTIICERLENKLAIALNVCNSDLNEFVTHTSDVKAMSESAAKKYAAKGIVHLFSKKKVEAYKRFAEFTGITLPFDEKTIEKDESKNAVFVNTNRSFTTDVLVQNYEGDDDLVIIIDRTTSDDEREKLKKIVELAGIKAVDTKAFYKKFAEKIGGSSQYLDEYPCMLQLLDVVIFQLLGYDKGAFIDDDFVLKEIAEWPKTNAFIMAKFDREKELHSSSSYSKVFEISKRCCNSSISKERFAELFHPGTEKVFVRGKIDVKRYIEMLARFIHDEELAKLFARWNPKHKHCGVWNSCEIFEVVAFEALGVFNDYEEIVDTLFIWPNHKLRLRNNLEKKKPIIQGIKDFNKVDAILSTDKMHVGYRGDYGIYWLLIQSGAVNPPLLESSLKLLENPDLRIGAEKREEKKRERNLEVAADKVVELERFDSNELVNMFYRTIEPIVDVLFGIKESLDNIENTINEIKKER